MNKQLFKILVSLSLLFGMSVNAKIYPLEEFALRDVVSKVELSPDGNKLAVLSTPSREGMPMIEIYDASNLSKKPFVMNADPMEIIAFDWVSNTNIVLTLRQKTRDEIDGFNRGVFDFKLAKLDVKKRKIKFFKESNPRIVNLLPDEPEKIILAFQPEAKGKSGVSAGRRPWSYYEFDLKKGRKKLIVRGQASMYGVRFDSKGNPVFARGFDRVTRDSIWYVREPGKKEWVEVFRLSDDSFEDFSIQGFDIKKNGLLVTAQNGSDTRGLWEFDYVTKKFGEVVFRHPEIDVRGVSFHSNSWTNPDTIVGVTYNSDRRHIEYFDGNEGAIHAQLRQIIPYAHNFSISSRAKVGQDMVIYNSGPRDPGTYYLLKAGKISTVGSKQPTLKSEDLADVKYMTYKSRDNKSIHSYVTIPQGEGPFPAIVLPHGGPFVAEMVAFDEWAQMLANNGYLVIQPEYRGSKGYGLEYYKSAFIEGGEGGYKMQDDKDDGVNFLVKKGLADPERIAMFGWSYGGYAALVAASRTPQLYQCVIAGAAVTDNLMQVNYYSARIKGASAVEQLTFWRDSISPITQAEKVNVPILLIHGSVDQRVPPEHQKRYRDELDKYNKSYKFVELDGADHFYNTLDYGHQLTLYTSMIDYLKNDCGPGGL
jgi:dipeptidyl aminopeptidase/acylaminoacyl peptidase